MENRLKSEISRTLQSSYIPSEAQIFASIFVDPSFSFEESSRRLSASRTNIIFEDPSSRRGKHDFHPDSMKEDIVPTFDRK